MDDRYGRRVARTRDALAHRLGENDDDTDSADLLAGASSSSSSAASFKENPDVIVPFHTMRAPSSKASRVPPHARTLHSGSKNNYNRVRRRSPLCHDVLEFMLEGASMSSQESLPLELAAPGLPGSVASAPKSKLALSDNGSDKGSGAPGPMLSAGNSGAGSQGQPSVRINTDSIAAIATASSPDSLSGGRMPEGAMNQRVSANDAGSQPVLNQSKQASSEANESDDSSDAGTGCDSDDGFDGKCSTSPEVVSSTSTAECSRSGSYRSSRSSETSDDSTATEPSLKWWRRRFRSSKNKSASTPSSAPTSPKMMSRGLDAAEVNKKLAAKELRLPMMSPSISHESSLPTIAHAATFNVAAAAAAENTHKVPILTKLRRSVSTKSSPKPSVADLVSTKRHSAGSSLQPPQFRLPTKLTRMSSITSPSPVSAADKLPKANAVGASTVSQKSMAAMAAPASANSTSPRESVNGEDTFEAQWALFKCKGMVNLHVASVPVSVSSLNHKDAFLFYPCLFRHIGDGALPLPVPSSVQSDDGSSATESSTSGVRHSQMPYGPLLAQEYSRRKSICALASRVIYVWIGAHAAAIKRDAITRVAMEIRDKELMGKAAVVLIDESTASDSARRKFFTQLHVAEHGDYRSIPSEISTVYNSITPLSKAGDDMDFERAMVRRKVMYGFWESVPPATIVSVGADINAAMLLKVPMGGVVVLDTWSDVFIWWRNEPSNTSVRKCAISFANMLIQDACIPPRPKSATVWHEIRGFEHVIFKTKFPDWPFVFSASMAATSQSARRVIQPVKNVMPPAALPMRNSSRSTRAVAVA
ncbi:hypothetical protein GGI07_003218 [Coemansia sp. Benny D115]|nr:hypothetical protein GGI07_003218 [Coemansia sp. Benny D115]